MTKPGEIVLRSFPIAFTGRWVTLTRRAQSNIREH